MLLNMLLPGLAVLLWWFLYGRPKKNASLQAHAVKQQGLHVWPTVTGWLPGNLDVLYNAMRNSKGKLPGAAMENLAATYGNTFNLKVLGSKMIYTQDPEVIRHVLSQNADFYVKGGFLNDLFRDVLGTGIFNSDGDHWKMHRNAARPFFLRENLEDFSVYARHTDALVATIRRLSHFSGSRETDALEFHDLASRFTLDAASEYLFGESIDTMLAAGPDQPDPPYLAAFDRVQRRLAARLRSGSIWRVFESKGHMAADMEIVSQLVQKAIAQAEVRHSHGIITQDHPTFLDLLNQPVNNFDAKTKQDELLNVMMAARDTTASLIASLLYELSKHPDVQARLRAEVKQRLGEDMRLAFEDVKHLKLLRAVINETLRMYPPISGNSRVALRDDKIEIQGEHYHVPAGTSVTWGVFSLQRRKDIWGSDADVWRPDRWLDNALAISKTASAFQAWGAGPRIVGPRPVGTQ